MAKFTPTQWNKVFALLDQDEARFDMPQRRDGSVVLASFNIRKLGKVKNRSTGAWEFLRRVADRCDLLAIQEVSDNLVGLNHLKSLLGEPYGMVTSDITGGVPASKQGMTERLAYLFRWERVARSEVASDLTFDRSSLAERLLASRKAFGKALLAREKELTGWEDEFQDRIEAWEAAGRPGSRPRRKKKPPFLLPEFLTFIRTPHCVSFQILGAASSIDFLAVNAHLLFGHKEKQREERYQEFLALMSWLVDRARQVKNLYHKNLILFGDLNLDFTKADARRTEIEADLMALNQGQLAGAKRAKVNFPFLDIHPSRAHIADPNKAVWRSTARLSETYDQIAMFLGDKHLPNDKANETAGANPDGFDYRVFRFTDLFAEALHGKAYDALTKTQKKALIAKFQHDVSDHLPIWIRLPIPA